MRLRAAEAVAGLALVTLAGSCWQPRSNSAAPGAWRSPTWERGAQAGAEAQAGAAVQLSWDDDGFPMSIVGVSSDPDGQRLASDILTEQILAEIAEGRVPAVVERVDAGLEVERLVPLGPRCASDAGPIDGCESPALDGRFDAGRFGFWPR